MERSRLLDAFLRALQNGNFEEQLAAFRAYMDPQKRTRAGRELAEKILGINVGEAALNTEMTEFRRQLQALETMQQVTTQLDRIFGKKRKQ